jgi:hypothetical protein
MVKLSKKDLGKTALKVAKTAKGAYNKSGPHEIHFAIETVCRGVYSEDATKFLRTSDSIMDGLLAKEDAISMDLNMSVFDEAFCQQPKVVKLHAKVADRIRKKVPYEKLAALFEEFVANENNRDGSY